MFYLKKLGHQELGSVTDEKGPQRGRYILISKKVIGDNFFPQLSTVQTNDNAILPIISMELNRKVYCNFVYHNDKITKNLANGRDEYRLYLNNDIENNQQLFKENDILVIAKRKNETENEFGSIYFTLRFSSEDPEYSMLMNIVTENNIGGGHAIYNKNILDFEERILAYDLNEANTQISDQIIEQISKSEKSIEDLFSTSTFRDFVMTGYKRKCAITGISISYEDLINLEAAHIKPRAHGEINLPCNGIAMSRDMHWAFDKGLFTINEDLTIKVHEDVKSDYLNDYNGKKIYVPDNSFFKPNKEYLEYHRKVIFGMFKFTGGIRKIATS